MSIVIIGGHSRSVGKTSVVAGLIAALRDLHWTALKITQYGHGVCSANGEACDCATADHSWAVSEEKDRSGESDTSRFLVAGADHSWWVRTQQGRLAEAMPRVRQILASAQNVIIESNSVLRFLSLISISPFSIPQPPISNCQRRSFWIAPMRCCCMRRAMRLYRVRRMRELRGSRSR